MERVAALERQTAGPEQCGQLFSEEVEDVKRRLDWLEDWSASPLSSYMLEDLEDWDGQRSTTTATVGVLATTFMNPICWVRPTCQASIDDLTACRFYSIEDRLERLEEAVWSWEAEGGEGTYEQPGQAYGTGKAWPGSEARILVTAGQLREGKTEEAHLGCTKSCHTSTARAWMVGSQHGAG
eukprot:symbB.v1.2.026018.t1/scaffold2529.1/size77954/6